MSNRFAGVRESMMEHERKQRALYPDYDLPEELSELEKLEQSKEYMISDLAYERYQQLLKEKVND